MMCEEIRIYDKEWHGGGFSGSKTDVELGVAEAFSIALKPYHSSYAL